MRSTFPGSRESTVELDIAKYDQHEENNSQ